LTPTCDGLPVTLGVWVTLSQEAVENAGFWPRVPGAKRDW
jgi:hypothetical protein